MEDLAELFQIWEILATSALISFILFFCFMFVVLLGWSQARSKSEIVTVMFESAKCATIAVLCLFTMFGIFFTVH